MLSGGSIQNFENNKSSVYEIGRGGYGIVYIDSIQKGSVFKVSNKANTCRDWSKESEIYTIINKFKVDDDLVKVLKMKDYVNTGHQCTMELTHAVNPIEENATYTIHPIFGMDKLEKNYPGRGLFLGLEQLYENKIFTAVNIHEYISQLGIVMAKLHYFVKNDGYDIELFISKNRETVEIFIGDFDLSEFINEYTDDIIKDRIIWSLTAVPYFPNPANELFQDFKKSYISEATKHGKEDIAKRVMVLYEESY
jgi:hypothetical protein